MATEVVVTSSLRLGDRVQNDVMTLLIDQELAQTRHPVDERGKTWATSAIIENQAELEVMKANGDLHAAWILAVSDKDSNGRARWTIQGNDLARWARII